MVKVSVSENRWGGANSTSRLLTRMLSPLCGLDQEIGIVSRGRADGRLVTAGADLTGVHVLRNQPYPGRGSYHIGGSGICLEEAVIRSLGETVERYCQLIVEWSGLYQMTFASYDEMLESNEPIIRVEQLSFYSYDQLARPGFPFQGFDPKLPLSWVRMPSLIDDRTIWIPAQLLFVGYFPKRDQGEPWLTSAVTSGTAAHTDVNLALLNALLELVQIDSAMGHWYSRFPAFEIVFDQRTTALKRLIDKYFKALLRHPKFYWIQNADLCGMTVACVMENPRGVFPEMCVGLGADATLTGAMYKALLEANGVSHLGNMFLLEEMLDSSDGGTFDPTTMFDLDRNVGYYAKGGNRERIVAKFLQANTMRASEAPKDLEGESTDLIRMVTDTFRNTGKELVLADLTTIEAEELGFVVPRVWSPDVLSLALPSAVPLRHGRFSAYGGVEHEDPHPYP